MTPNNSQPNLEVIFSGETFRDMILFSGRFANQSIPESEWKEVYGFLVGKIIDRDNAKYIYVQKLIPMVHGTRTEVYFSEQDYAISEPIMEELLKLDLFVCGWYHTHPGLDLFLSDTDLYNQLGFQSVFNDAIAVVFDFTKISEKNNGLKVYRLDDVEQGVASTYHEVPYEIEKKEDSSRTIFARSLIDIASSYMGNQPLIKEAGEILHDSGSISDVIGSANLQSNNKTEIKKEYVSDLEQETVPKDRFKDLGDFKEQISDVETAIESSVPDNTNDEDISYDEILDEYSENDYQIRAIMENIDRAKENGKPTGYLFLKLANRYMEISKNAEALEYLQSAEAEFIANNDKQGEAIAKNELGLYYEDRGIYDNALNYLEASLQLLSELDLKHKKVQVLNNIGNIYIKMNDHATAFSYYKEAYILSSNINYPLGMIVALNNSVDVLLFLQNYRLAYNAIGQVYKFFEATQNAYGIGMALSKFGHLYFTQGDLYYPLSEKYFRLAIDVKVKNNFFKETLDDWVFLYEIFKFRKDLPSAEICLTQGLNIIRTYEIDKEEGRFYKLFGDLYLMKNKIEEALDYYKMALENFEEFADEENKAKMNDKLAVLFLERKNNIEQAINYYYAALESYKIQKYERMVADTLVKISDLQVKQGDKNSAIECLHEANAIYRNLFDEYNINLTQKRLEKIQSG